MSKAKLSKETTDDKVKSIDNSDFTYSSMFKDVGSNLKKVFKKHPIIFILVCILIVTLAGRLISESIHMSSYDGVVGSMSDEFSVESVSASLDSGFDGFSMPTLNSKSESYSGANEFSSDSKSNNSKSYSSQVEEKPVIETGASSEELHNSNNKIIYTGHLNVRTPKFAETNALVRQKVTTYGGYLEGYDISDTYATYKVRVPAKNFDAYMSDTDIHTGNNVTSNVSSQDVTLSYSETESVLASLKVREERLLNYLSKAANITEMLKIEEELQEVRGKIESHQNQLNLMDSFINYSIITVEIRSTSNSVPVTNISFIDKLLETLQEAGEDFVDYGEDLLFGIILSIPVIIFGLLRLGIIVLFVWIVLVIIKKCVNKARKKKASKASFKPDNSVEDESVELEENSADENSDE